MKILIVLEKILRTALFICSVVTMLYALFQMYTIFRPPYPVIRGLINVIGYAFVSLVSAGMSMILHYDIISKE